MSAVDARVTATDDDAPRPPDVRVGIVSWNTAALLDRCLAALPAALGDLRAEVVVVDNASDDGSAEVAAHHDGVTVVRHDANLGYAVGMNRALADTDAPVLVALNPDTEPPPGSLAALVARLHATPRAGLVVPRLVHPDGRLQHSVYRFPSIAVGLVVSLVPPRWQRGRVGRRWWLEGAAPHDTPGPVDWAIGAVHVLRADALGPGPVYRERWFMYVEDLDLCWRLHAGGWEVHLAPDVAVPHVGNAAGAQAWGRRRSHRYWAATYDFLGQVRGAGYARRLAAVNVAGLSWYLLRRVVGGLLLPGRRRPRRAEITEHATLIALHARTAVRGPRPETRRA